MIRPARLSYFRRSGRDRSRYGNLVAHRAYWRLSALTNENPQNLRSISYRYSTSNLPLSDFGTLIARALRASVSASSASLPYNFGSAQKNQSKSHTIISGSVLPSYLPNGTAVQCISSTLH